MKRNLLFAISLALVVAMVGWCGCNTDGTALGKLSSIQLNSQQEGIWVSGQGKVTAVPDLATLRLGIEAQEASVAEAQTQAAEAMDKVMAALIDNGVAEKDIQTQYFSIRQVTKWNRETEEETVIGYKVTNKVTAKIRDVDYESRPLDYRVGIIIDAVATAGGDLTRIDSIGFSIDDPSAYYEEARGKAMADAEAKAEQLANLAGVKLGKPTYIAEGISYPIHPEEILIKGGMAPAPMPPTPISPGEIEITLTVRVAYAILN